MPTVKRFNRLLGLEKIDVLVDDKDTSRHIIITDMPQSLPQGKSSFLIEVSPYMKEGIELQIDFMDSAGNSIYLEPVQNYLEGSSRTISVEVYDTTAAGVATIIIVGELDEIPTEPGSYSEVEEVPEEFQGVYNVRLSREVIINTAEMNIQPIKFYSSPRLIARERRFGTMEREVVDGEVVSDAFTVIGRPITQEPFEKFEAAVNESTAQGTGTTETTENQPPSPPVGDIKGDEAEKEKLKQHSKKRSVRGDSRGKRSKRIRRRNSPIEYPYSFTITNDAHTFTSLEIGGEIRFSDIDTSIYSEQDIDANGLETPTFNVVSDISDENYPTHYTASIADLNNSITAYTNTPFTKQNREGDYRILKMKATGKTYYEKQPSASFSLVNIVSYADITLSHLRTFSGELFKAKVYVRSEGSFDDYKLLAEVPIESPELMVNSNSVGIGERTGYFISEEDKNTYWDLFGSTNGLTAASTTSTASYDNNVVLDSIMVSGSTSAFTDQIRFQLKDDYKFNLTKNVDYTLSFNAVGQKDTDGRALMLIYVSGSCMKQANGLYHDEFTKNNIEESSAYGKRMGVLEVETTEDTKKDFRLVAHNFNSNLTGDATVQFRVIAGQWNLSDISLVPATDTGFSPSFVAFQQELPPELTHKRPDTLEFLTEFYDINNNIADEVAVTTGSVFTGANIVITGDDNTISGDLFIGGDTTASGMHFGGVDSTLPETGEDGATGSGFMRSVGYLGFVSASAQSGSYGFMIYSGSVLPNSGDEYNGVGLELVGASGSLRFRTNPSSFDVQADSFFVGKTTTQFISGSGGNVEISSSNFHLTPEGNVTMSGTITAEAGFIGGFTIGSNTLSTTGALLGDSTQEHFISSSAFKVDHSGNVTASNIDLGGKITATSGEIGGWTIGEDMLSAGAGNSSVSMSGDDQLIKFGSGSTFVANEIDGIIMGKDTDGKYKFGAGKGGSYIFFDGSVMNIASDNVNVTASVFSIDVDQFKLSATNLFISSSGGGFIQLGSSLPTGVGGTNKGIYMQGRNPDDNKAKFLVGDAAGGHISFDGDNVFMSSSAFFLGSPTQFVSGSLGNIEISSSNFHLDNAGNVTMTGTVTAAAGEIGGLTIGDTKLSSGTSYEISSSTNVSDPVSFISSSGFKVSAGGQVTASALSLTGGDVGGLAIESGVISVGTILKLKDSGQITGSKVLFTGGTIGGFTIDADEIKSTNVLIDSGNEKITLGSGNAITLQGGATDNFLVMGAKDDFSEEGTGTAGILIGMDATNPQAEFVKDSSNYFIFDDGIDIQTDTLKASGSNIILEAPRFFLGKETTTFVSGSNGNIEISASAFHLTPEGNITASNILLGDKGGANYLQFAGDTLTVRGDLAVDSLFLPATIAGVTSTLLTASSSLNSTGFAKFVSASIGGFVVDSSQINSANNNIVLEADGAATISGSSINLQTPKFYLGESSNYISGSQGNIKIFSTGDTTLSGSSVNIQTPKFYFGESGNFISGSGGNITIQNTGTTTLSGSAVDIKTPKFYLGESDNFISGSNGNIEIFNSGTTTISGSSVKIETPKFYLGQGSTQYVSGSNGNIEISSSMFHLDPKTSKMTLSGSITATSGKIGGFTINGTKLEQGVSFNLDGASDATYFISSSKFQVTPTGDVSGSQVLFTGGKIGGWAVGSTLSATNILLDPATPKITLGSKATLIDSNTGLYLGTDGLAVGASSVLKITSAGQITGSNVLFTAGKIAGFTIDGNTLTATNFTLDASGKSISLGSGTDIFVVDGDVGLQLGHGTFASAPFSVTKAGVLKATSGTIAGWVLTANRFNDSGDNVRIDSNAGSISIKNHTFGQSGIQLQYNSGTSRFYVGDGSNKHIKFDGSDVDIKSGKFELDASNVEISSTHASMSLGEGKIRLIGASTSTMTLGAGASSVTMSADGTDTFIQFGDKTTFGQTTAHGVILGSDNGVPKFDMTSGSLDDNYFRFSGAAGGGLDIKTNDFILDTINLDINSVTKRIEVSDGSATRVRIGEVDSTSANHFGITIYDGTGTAASDEIVHLSDAKYQIASWSLSPTQISSGNLILDSAGTIQTSDFAGGVKGWRISSTNNGEAEFENVRIRGTLSTAVFEKETVNAVGGQLYIANSTAITGSTTLAAAAATMSVVNVSGFAADEILSAKKISATGFGTEYMLVQSASRDLPSSDTNFAGKLYLVRGYRSGSIGASGSLGGTPNISQSYEPGQVIVSTGKIGTGYIRLNANPNDQTTPYMDIVERTGSGVYDVELKARLGDLSGLSSGLLYGNTTPGFGLFTENVFLSGAITATTGSITGILHVRTDLSNQITMGTNVKNSLDGIRINDNNFWYTTGDFRVGQTSSNYIHVSGSTIDIKAGTFDLDATTLIIDSANNDGSIRLGGSGGPNSPTANTAGIYMDGGGAINVFGNTTNLLRMDGAGTLTMKSDEFNLETSTIKIDSTTNSGKIALGATAPTTISGSNTGVYLDGKGNFRAGKPGHGRIEWDGTDVYVSSSAFFLGSETQFLSGSNGNIEISSSNFHLQPDGDVVMSGTITADAGNIGGFEIGSNVISSSNGELVLNADGGITGSNFLLEGGVITADVTIQGDLSANSISTPSDGSGVKATINALGYAKFISASIGGFDIDSAQIKSTNDALILNSIGQITASAAKISGDITITAGDLAGVDAATISGSVSEVSASLALASASMATQVKLSSTGMSLNKADGTSLANYGVTTRIGLAADARTEITSTAISMYSGKVSGTAYKRVAIDNTGKIAMGGAAGADVAIDTTDDVIRIVPGTGITIFDSDADKLLLNSDGMTLTENSQVRAIFGAVTAIGSAGAAVTTTSTDDVIRIADGTVSIFQDDDNKAVVNSSGLTVTQGSNTVGIFGSDVTVGRTDGTNSNVFIDSSEGTVQIRKGTVVSASFGATTTIGPTGGSHVSINSEAININRGAVTFLSASAAGLEMSGSIRATGGTIGGFTLSTTEISASGLVLKANGQMTASAVSMSGMINASSGQIGNFAIDSNNLVGGTTFKLDPTNNAGELMLGTSFGPEAIDGTGAGFYVNGDGDFNLVIDAANRIHNDGGLFVLTEKFDLDAGTLILDSETNSGKLALGGTPPTAYNSGVGVYLDGTGKALIGNSTGSRIQFDGGNLIMSASTFFLGGGGQFISGSNENIEISSSAFHLDTVNNTMKMSGSITATGGTIGGFTIGSTKLENIHSLGSNAFISASIDMGDGTTPTILLKRMLDNDANDYHHIRQRVTNTGAELIVFDAVDANKAGQASLSSTTGKGLVQVKAVNTQFGAAIDILADPGGDGATFSVKSDQLGISRYSQITGTSGLTGILMQVSQSAGSTHHAHFFAGKDGGSHIHYDGANDNLHLSSSNFFLGGGGQYVSGSNGNIEISSSVFHLTRDGNVTMSGSITATAGEIGGFTITNNALSSTDFFISGSPTTGGNDDPEYMFISASNFNVKANGDVTASALSLTGGDIFGTEISKIQAGAVSASAAIGPTGNLTANLTGTIGGTANATVRSGAAKGEAAIDGSGNLTANLTGTIGGVANATVRSGAAKGEAAIDGSGNLTANLTGTIGGLSSTTVKTRAITAVSEYVIFSDAKFAGASTGNSAATLNTYIQTGTAGGGSVGDNKVKIAFTYVHDTNNAVLTLTCLAKQSENTATGGRCRLAIGITDLTANAGYLVTSGDELTGDTAVNLELATDHGATYTLQSFDLTKLSVIQVDGADLVNNRIYQISISLRGGQNAARNAGVTVSMIGACVIATAVG